MGFKLEWPIHTKNMNSAPTSTVEIANAFAEVQNAINNCGLEQQPFANIIMRNEIAQALEKVLKINDPELFIAIASVDPNDDYNAKQNCMLKQFIVAKYKHTFDRVREEATDW